jgi:alcohol dehydrogenase/L-iditol 2-dehydrogenase
MAAVLREPGAVDVRHDWPEPSCGPDEVIVAVRAVGLCGSDLAVFTGKRAVPALPWVLGHEAIGDIVAVGERVSDRQIGQRVVIEPNYPCLECPSCLAGATATCPRRRAVGISEPGALVERLAVPAGFAWPVPASWPDEDLVCVEPMAVARSAVVRSGARAGVRCLVVGAGAQGLLVCQTLLAVGAVPYVTDPNPGRARLARELGAHDLAELNDAAMFGVVIETSGAPEALELAVFRAAPDGCVALIGQSSVPARLASFPIVQRRLTLRGCLIYDHPDDFASTIRALSQAAARPGSVVRARYPLAEAARALREAGQVAGKSWIALPRSEPPTAPPQRSSAATAQSSSPAAQATAAAQPSMAAGPLLETGQVEEEPR